MALTLKEELNLLIAKYSLRDVHEALKNRMELDYVYLTKIFGEKKKKEEKVVEVPKVVVEEKKPVAVEENNEVVENDDVEVVVEEKKYRDPKEMKAWQKEQEDKKRKEQMDKGIVDPKILLTKENLQKWYGEEGKTFSYIAREYVGCKDTEVSAAVKFHGITNNRKNIMIRAVLKKKQI